MSTLSATYYTTIQLGEDEYDVRVEAEVLTPSDPGHYSWDPHQYDPGSGAELGGPTYTVEFAYIHPKARDVVLPPRAVARYWSLSQRVWHLHELRANEQENAA